ncbi:MAG: hypothetical protein ABJA02_04195 [Acidobacteriota bacterium]
MKTLLFFVLCLLVSLPVAAQNGGKAEPKEIKFAAGASIAIVTGTLSNGQEHDFVFSARKGQKVKITNSHTSQFDFRVFNEEFNFETEFESSPTLSFEIPETGDYLFFVRKKMTAPRTARFSLTLKIK